MDQTVPLRAENRHKNPILIRMIAARPVLSTLAVAGLLVFAHHLGRKAGAEEVTERVNAVLQHQYEINKIGGTWDAVAETLNGKP